MVIIVGGGPAGSSTAFFLAKAGVDVTLLDRAHFPRDKTCSEYLSPQASRILAAMNALSSVEESGAAQLAGMRVHAPNGATIHGEFAAQHGFRGYRDRGLAIRRTILDSILLDRAREAGVNVQEGVRVTDILRAPDNRVSGVTTIDANGGPFEHRAELVVGADGLRSVIGRRLNLIRASRWPKRIALVAHYSGVDHSPEFGEMYVDRGGYCGIANVGAAEIAIDRTEFLESWIAERPVLAERFKTANRATPVRATGPFATSAKRAWVRGAALVGDAAEFFDPFTGEGIYTALRGGEMLAGLIEGPVRAGLPADTALRQYERERRKEFSGKSRGERVVAAA
jgi:flavin-dependent dehydrogenase